MSWCVLYLRAQRVESNQLSHISSGYIFHLWQFVLPLLPSSPSLHLSWTVFLLCYRTSLFRKTRAPLKPKVCVCACVCVWARLPAFSLTLSDKQKKVFASILHLTAAISTPTQLLYDITHTHTEREPSRKLLAAALSRDGRSVDAV